MKTSPPITPPITAPTGKVEVACTSADTDGGDDTVGGGAL